MAGVVIEGGKRLAGERECGIDGWAKGGMKMNDDSNPIGQETNGPVAPLKHAEATLGVVSGVVRASLRNSR